MKLIYAIVLVLMILVSACAQQPAAQPAKTQPTVQPEAEAEPQPQPEAGAAAAAPEEEEKAPEAAAGDEVRILGVGKYDPAQVSISAGGSITFLNEGKLKSVITIKGKSGITNTPIVNPGEKYEQKFAEAGEYDVWAVSYGPGVKVNVK